MVRNDSGSHRALPKTPATSSGSLLAGLYETEPLRRGAEARLREHLSPDLDALADETAREIARRARANAKTTPAQYANGILRKRRSVREIASDAHSRAIEAFNRSLGPPPDDEPPRGGAPRSGGISVAGSVPRRSAVVRERGANGYLVERVAEAGRLDPFALLEALGVGRAA